MVDKFQRRYERIKITLLLLAVANLTFLSYATFYWN